MVSNHNNNVVITLSLTELTLWVAPAKMFYNTIGLEFNGAENNGGIAHILSTLLINSYDL